MKIERISDTQVRCTLTSFDLSIRNVNLKELTYGSEKARNLFSEMMQRAMQEFGFETDGFPIMVEAIPMKDDSIELVITRVDEPDEVDTRFSRFAPAGKPGTDAMSCFAELAKLGQDPQNKLQSPPEEGTMRTFVFDSLDAVIAAARATDNRFRGRNSLYKDEAGRKYCLALEDTGEDEVLYLSTCNVLSEYGKPVVQNCMGLSYMKEHYKTIIRENALDNLLNI